MAHSEATYTLMATNHVILNQGQAMRTTLDLAPLQKSYRYINVKNFEPPTDLTKISTAGLQCTMGTHDIRKNAGHQFSNMRVRLPRPHNHLEELWLQQDGATCPTARATIDLLKDTFGDRLISRFGPVNWPPRSCDLTPLDYTGTAIRGFSSGRPRGTTPADDRYIVLQARRNRRQTTGEIARHTTQATGRPISRFTVARRLHGGGLFARRPVRCVPLTPAHRRRRTLWCREHRNWRDNEWGRVLFTDESRFSLSSDYHRILIWRERGSHNHPSNIIERDRYGGRGVLVWGGIMLGSRTDLHIFDSGLVNETRYCNEILLPYVRLFRGAMSLQFLFMDDNAPCHRTVAAEQLLESEDIERMDWPARSPDLNPIEHVWDFLGRRLAARTLPLVTIRELRLALQDEWAAMPQQLIDILIPSMGRRCETCLAVRGDHIPY
ncbi:transposable element Tcb2 transposase [Trichonephila clavipes]|nr:transposable element Tcb2 transposase [Trichonephila clavipes]